MPIFDQGYQHFDGSLSGHTWRWWAITRQGLRAQLRNRWTKYLVISAWVPALLLATFLALWGLFEQKSSVLQPILFLFQALPEEIKEGPKAFRGTMWTMAFHFFLWLEVGTAMVLVLVVGPDLISQDLRFNAIPLYLSRPMRRFDYFAGKLGVIATFLAAVMVFPAVLAYVIGVGFSLDLAVIRDTWRILVGSIAYGVVVALVSGLIMLALSSLSRNSRVVATMWASLWMISWIVSMGAGDAFRGTDARRPWEAISYTGNLDRMRQVLLDTESANDQLQGLLKTAQETAMNAARGGLPGISKPRGPLERLLDPRRRASEELAREMKVSVEEQNQQLRDILVSPYPWTWSAAILAALSIGSIAILSTRVRSLDRLK